MAPPAPAAAPPKGSGQAESVAAVLAAATGSRRLWRRGGAGLP
eukprot:CAMPEP_0119088680 /NCGR_PEP_ID=MMETSP1178-20130426/146365_1 /TAXON_ID=33656 /ORGANISM="unid sp, Strain CCMP2000" /LENGTH=42 /DNA_ID= /DNA_START= /DNA_END= /DNA_ORIENTATION=